MIRIVMFCAEPIGHDPLLLEKEIHSIRVALKFADPKEVEFRPITGASLSDLVNTVPQENWDIVHFAGHAGPLLEAAEHAPLSLRKEVLLELFRVCGERIQLVVFNPCHSAEIAEDSVKYVRTAVGYPGELDNELAVEYAGCLYSALAAGWSIREAHDIARLPLRHAGLSDADMPVLFERGPGTSKAVRFDPAPSAIQGESVSILVKTNLSAERYSDVARKSIAAGLAHFLRISPEAIQITHPQPVEDEEALIVTLRVPRDKATQLTEAIEKRDPQLHDLLVPLVLDRVDPGKPQNRAEGMEGNEISVAPRIFISYSHDSREHEQRVLELANRLRRDGLDCVIDRYFVMPQESWLGWMAEQVSHADFVLVVCTENYWRRFEEKPGAVSGAGAKWEGSILRQELYEAESGNTYIPVIFSAVDVNYIPLALKGTTFCRLDSPAGYERLLRRVLRQPAVTGLDLEQLRALPPRPTQNEPLPPSAAAIPSNLPFSPNPFFTGRQEELDKLRRLLTAKHTAAITRPLAIQGLGGIGKTQLALEYAWKQRAEYSALLWVQGDTPDLLHASFAALAGPQMLNLPEASASDQNVVIQAVLRWLRSNQGWLLIFDQADTPEALQIIRELQSVPARGHIIITSRFAHWSPDIPSLSLDTLSSAEAVDFLLQRTGTSAGDPAAAARLAETLGFLPLALEQAAAYIRNRESTFERYRHQLEVFRAEMVLTNGMDATGYRASLAAIWLISLEHLDRLGRTILRLSAFTAPSDIPTAMFRMQKEILSEALAAAYDSTVPPDAATEAAFTKSLAQLAEYSLIALTSDSFSIHPLVQAAQRETLSAEQRKQWVGFALRIVNDYSPTPPDDPRNWPIWDRLYPHADALLVHAESYGVSNDSAMRLTNQVGGYVFSKGQFEKAEPLYRRALTIAETAFGPADRYVVTCLNNLAELLRATGRFAEAEPLCRRALTIAQSAFGANNRYVVTCLNNLAEVLRAMARLTEAEPLYRQALASAEAAFDPEHPDVAVALNNLAGLLSETNRLAEAEALYYRALRLDEATFGPNHPNVATDLNNLAALLRATNRLAEAEPLYRRAVTIYEEQLGPEHPDTAESLNNLAAVYDAQNRFAEAESLYRYVLVAQERALGPENPKLSTALSNYASLMAREGRLAEAEPLYRRALEIDEAALGPAHPNVAIRLNNLASLLSASNRGAEATALLEQAVDILGKSVGPEHPVMKQVIENAASMR